MAEAACASGVVDLHSREAKRPYRDQSLGAAGPRARVLFLRTGTASANRLTQRGGASLTYDDGGNLTGDGTYTYTWDARNQLASINGPGLAASFVYDSLGRRVGKTVNGQATGYLYDGDNVVQELIGGASAANMLAGGIDEIFLRTDGAGQRAFLADALGSTLALLDSAGVAQTSYTYDPFGATRPRDRVTRPRALFGHRAGA